MAPLSSSSSSTRPRPAPIPATTEAAAISSRFGRSGEVGGTACSTTENRSPLDNTSIRSPVAALASRATAVLYWPWMFS